MPCSNIKFDLVNYTINLKAAVLWKQWISDKTKPCAILHLVLRRVLGANSVACSYIDKFAPFHNQMGAIHNIFVKFLQTIYFYKAESARKIDAQLNFQYTGITGCLMIFGVEKLKEYSVILIKSFYDINQQILRKNGYFQNFSWFWFSVCKLCMIMYISTAQ